VTSRSGNRAGGLADDLASCARGFGPEAAARKLELLQELLAQSRLPKRGRRRTALDGALAFLRAHPDDARVSRAVEAVLAALPPLPRCRHGFSYGVALRVPRLFDDIDVDWEDVDDDSELGDALVHVLLPGEIQGCEDVGISLADWFRHMRPTGSASDLEVLLGLFERAPLAPRLRAYLFDQCYVPLAFTPASAAELRLPCGRTHFQRGPLERGTPSIAEIVRRAPAIAPAGSGAHGGRAVVDLALRALCSRGLQIYPLIHADERDVLLADCGRGLRFALIGVKPEFRTPLETLYFALVLKNGVPIAYGPVAVFLGASEIGINLFPEFRGGEVRRLYAEFMRVLHHVFGVEHFHLTSYGVGENNPEAIASGAFWFYRRLGFRPAVPKIEALAREEEARMARDPKHRSDRRMLRRLSRTSIHLDLSDGRRTPFPFGPHGIAQSRWIAREFDGDRRRAEGTCARRIARRTGLPATLPALRAFAPALCMIPELASWPRRDVALLARILRAKGARSEAPAAKLLNRHARLEQGLRASCAPSG